MVRLTPTRLLSAVVLLSVYALFFRNASRLWGGRGYTLMPERPTPQSPLAHDVAFGEECSPFASGAMEDVAIVIKIGSAEVASALPAYLDRLGRCRLDVLIFSDRSAEVHGHRVIDALANLRPEYRYQNPDFEIYDRIQAGEGAGIENEEGKTDEGWRLDKYKFLPMMELAAHHRPKSNWFVFLELDTYVNWDNMYRFLAHFNPSGAHFFGSPVWPPKKTTFAHGGSGFVVSRGAMNKLVARGRMFAENHHFPGTHLFGKDLTSMCCGDESLAHVLNECGVPLRGYWPMFNGERPSTVRFNWEQWCEAILTLHHVFDRDHEQLKLWESQRQNRAQPWTFEELFTFIEPQIRDKIYDWDNMCEDREFKPSHPASRSVEKCLAACLKDKKCIQYEHTGDQCKFSYSIRLGSARNPEGDKKWVSGWMLDRIATFKAKHSPCLGAHFVHPNP